MMAMLVMIMMWFSDDEDDEMKVVVTLVACLPLTDADVKSKCKRCMQMCTLMIRLVTTTMKKVEIGTAKMTTKTMMTMTNGWVWQRKIYVYAFRQRGGVQVHIDRCKVHICISIITIIFPFVRNKQLVIR